MKLILTRNVFFLIHPLSIASILWIGQKSLWVDIYLWREEEIFEAKFISRREVKKIVGDYGPQILQINYKI